MYLTSKKQLKELLGPRHTAAIDHRSFPEALKYTALHLFIAGHDNVDLRQTLRYLEEHGETPSRYVSARPYRGSDPGPEISGASTTSKA